MDRDKQKKICLISISLGKGGLERCVALFSNMYEKLGYEVHIVILEDEVDYEYSGTLENLGQFNETDKGIVSRLKRLIYLRKYLKSNNFDLIVDNRTRKSGLVELFYLNYIYRGFKRIYMVHSSNINEYFTDSNFIVKYIVKHVKKVITVSKGIQELIEHKVKANNIVTIYNPIEELGVKHFGEEPKRTYILFLGRLVDSVKNISLLLEAYSKAECKKGLPLFIYGEGPDKELIQGKIQENNLQNHVFIKSFTSNVEPLIVGAKFLCLTSYYEGFPRVLIEALSLGTPVVSVDCETGPREIISNGENGLLVENHNSSKLALAFDRMALDKELYEKCKLNATESVAHLKVDSIIKEWEQLFYEVFMKSEF